MGMEERRAVMNLSKAQIDEIAEVAAEKAMSKLEAKMYQEVGKAFVSKFFVMVGAVVFGVYSIGVVRGWWK
jgi:hypothetical protein